jgi:hypothetical protein
VLTVVFAVLAVAAAAAAIILFIRLRRQGAAHRQLAREHDEFKARYQAVIDVEAEKARVLGALEVERAGVQADIAGA